MPCMYYLTMGETLIKSSYLIYMQGLNFCFISQQYVSNILRFYKHSRKRLGIGTGTQFNKKNIDMKRQENYIV